MGVDADLLASKGAACAEVAEAMARGARERLDADIAVSVTGYAGPEAPSPEGVGLVLLGLADAKGVRSRRFHFGGDRGEVRKQAVDAALAWLLDATGPEDAR